MIASAITRGVVGVVSALSAAPATGQWGLFGFTDSGDLVRIDPDTGQRTAVGNIGVGGIVGAGWGPGSALYAMTDTDRVLVVDPVTAHVVGEYAVTGRPPSETIADIQVDWYGPNPALFAMTTAPPGNNVLYRATLPGPLILIGDTGVSGLVGIDEGRAIDEDGRLFRMYFPGGVEPLPMLPVPDGGVRAFAALLGTRATAAGLWKEVWASPTPRWEAVLLSGFGDIRALAWSDPCEYADMDCCPGVGRWDIFDFLTFHYYFEGQAPKACDCDLSTGWRTCDIFDFLCFQNAFTECAP